MNSRYFYVKTRVPHMNLYIVYVLCTYVDVHITWTQETAMTTVDWTSLMIHPPPGCRNMVTPMDLNCWWTFAPWVQGMCWNLVTVGFSDFLSTKHIGYGSWSKPCTPPWKIPVFHGCPSPVIAGIVDHSRYSGHWPIPRWYPRHGQLPDPGSSLKQLGLATLCVDLQPFLGILKTRDVLT